MGISKDGTLREKDWWRYGSRGAPKRGLRSDLLEKDLAWYAGFVDGEGCVGVYKRKDPGSNSLVYYAVLAISHVEPAPLVEIQSFYSPGVISIKHVPTKSEKHRDQCRIDVPQRYLLDTLSALIPHLRNKTEQAWVTMDFLITRFSNQYPLNHKVFQDYCDDLKRLKVA